MKRKLVDFLTELRVALFRENNRNESQSSGTLDGIDMILCMVWSLMFGLILCGSIICAALDAGAFHTAGIVYLCIGCIGLVAIHIYYVIYNRRLICILLPFLMLFDGRGAASFFILGIVGGLMLLGITQIFIPTW